MEQFYLRCISIESLYFFTAIIRVGDGLNKWREDSGVPWCRLTSRPAKTASIPQDARCETRANYVCTKSRLSSPGDLALDSARVHARTPGRYSTSGSGASSSKKMKNLAPAMGQRVADSALRRGCFCGGDSSRVFSLK